jgi:hypothetical protein
MEANSTVCYVGETKLTAEKCMTRFFQRSGVLQVGVCQQTCPHQVVYALKFLLRAEGPRDYVDILLSLKYQPSITLVDMAHIVTAHGNAHSSGMFQPYEGRVTEGTSTNIKSAEQLQVAEDHSYNRTTHSVTGVFDRYCLFDKLHEGNPKKKLRHFEEQNIYQS